MKKGETFGAGGYGKIDDGGGGERGKAKKGEKGRLNNPSVADTQIGVL
jgi:hypothetical protein